MTVTADDLHGMLANEADDFCTDEAFEASCTIAPIIAKCLRQNGLDNTIGATIEEEGSVEIVVDNFIAKRRVALRISDVNNTNIRRISDRVVVQQQTDVPRFVIAFRAALVWLKGSSDEHSR